MKIGFSRLYSKAKFDFYRLLRSDASSRGSSRGQNYACSFLHACLVLLHATLLGLYPYHLEHGITANLGRQTTVLNIATTTLAQLVGTVRHGGIGSYEEECVFLQSP